MVVVGRGLFSDERGTPEPAAFVDRGGYNDFLRARCDLLARCLSKLAHIRQSEPDSGLGFQVKFLDCFFKGVPLH